MYVMPDHDRACLDRAWTIISHLICLLQVRIPIICANSELQWRLLHLTRVAESMLRRWLVLKACVDGNWPRLANQPIPSFPSIGPSTRRATLALNEPDPRAPVFIYQSGQKGAPGLYVLTHTIAMDEADISPPRRALNLAALKHRIESLVAVVSAPASHIARMARWLVRAAARGKRMPCKLHPFRVGWPPGASRRQRRLDPERQSMLLYLDTLARDAVQRAIPP